MAQSSSAAASDSGEYSAFGEYELLDELGRGGMGVVYMARQRRLGRIVALKMISAGAMADEADVRRFYYEAETAASLDHPGIVPVLECRNVEGQHYYSMAYISGTNLSETICSGPLPLREAVLLLIKVADAVEYAHQRGIIHRDLKPANILVDFNQEPYITDFGLAKRVAAHSDSTLTGQIMGTPAFMAPEQATGKKSDVGIQSDVYALGAILYSLLTGQPPFRGANVMETLQRAIEEQPRPLRLLNPAVTRDLEAICFKCLEKDGRRRYESAAALSEDLDRWMKGERIQAREFNVSQRVESWIRGHRAMSFAFIGVCTMCTAWMVLVNPSSFTVRFLPWFLSLGAITIAATVNHRAWVVTSCTVAYIILGCHVFMDGALSPLIGDALLEILWAMFLGLAFSHLARWLARRLHGDSVASVVGAIEGAYVAFAIFSTMYREVMFIPTGLWDGTSRLPYELLGWGLFGGGVGALIGATAGRRRFVGLSER